jgi:hypothetical protein
MTDTALYYALSTIAQCAAALAALIGFFGHQRVERLQETLRQLERAIDRTLQQSPRDIERISFAQRAAVTGKSPPQKELILQRRLTALRTRCHALQNEREQFMQVLSLFLLGTLAILAIAIVLLVFVPTLYTWVWTMRVFVIVASVWLGSAPACVLLQATGRAQTLRQCLPRLVGQILSTWTRIGNRVRAWTLQRI